MFGEVVKNVVVVYVNLLVSCLRLIPLTSGGESGFNHTCINRGAPRDNCRFKQSCERSNNKSLHCCYSSWHHYSLTASSARGPTESKCNVKITYALIAKLSSRSRCSGWYFEFPWQIPRANISFMSKLCLSLIEQQCTGEWPRSVLWYCHASEGFLRKHQQGNLIFMSPVQEPKDAECFCLAAELSVMKQDPSDSVDRFAFKFLQYKCY